MRKILFGVYDKFSHDQRAIETIMALSMIGDLTVVSYDKIDSMDNVNFVVSGGGKKNYLSFKKCLRKEYKKLNPDFVFLHDNYTAFFINWVKKRNPNSVIFYDSSELYYDQKRSGIIGLKSNILNLQEFKYINRCDIIFAANIERAMIMKDYFHLSKVPIVWDNIHKIDDNIDHVLCDKKFDHIFVDNKKVIFYCGGIHENRGTFDLIKAVEELGSNYMLIVAGTASENDIDKFNKLFNKSKTKNYSYVGFLTRSELRYLLRKSFISVSIFDFSCVNHIFCASGKVYESLFEGVPVLTSINPPFKRLCDDYGVGVSCLNYVDGIKNIEKNYEKYKKNIKKYIENIDYENRVSRLKKIIENELLSMERNNE